MISRPKPPATGADAGVPDFMTDTLAKNRLGVIHLFANMEYESRAKIVAFAGIDMTAIGISAGGDMRRMNEELGAHGLRAGRQTILDAIDGVAKYLLGELKDLIDGIDGQSQGKVAKDFQDPMPDIEATFMPMIQDICRHLAGNFVAAAVPFVGSARGIVDCTVEAMRAGMRRYRIARLGRGVDVLDGMPSSVVRGILNGMDRRLACGVYDVLKSVGSLAVEAATAGVVAPLLRLAMAVAEVLVNTLWRLYDLTRMKRFSRQARQYRDEGVLHRRPEAFNGWFGPMALGVPAVAAIALRSGVCGDKMHFLRMFDAEGRRVSQAAFDDGVRYLDTLRKEASRYLNALGYGFWCRDRTFHEHLARALKWDAKDESAVLKEMRP